MRGRNDIAALGAALLAGCGPSLPDLADGVVDAVTIDLAVVDPPEGVVLAAATLRVDAVILDRCGGATSLIPAEVLLDGLGPSPEPIWVPPGGYCGLQLVLPEDPPPLDLAGTRDGAPWETAAPVDGVAVLTPFFLGPEDALLVLRLGAILADPADEGPTLAELWVDADGDGRLSDADRPLPQ